MGACDFRKNIQQQGWTIKCLQQKNHHVKDLNFIFKDDPMSEAKDQTRSNINYDDVGRANGLHRCPLTDAAESHGESEHWRERRAQETEGEKLRQVFNTRRILILILLC